MGAFAVWKVFFIMLFVLLMVSLTAPVISHLQHIGYGFTQNSINGLTWLWIAFVFGIVLLFIILF